MESKKKVPIFNFFGEENPYGPIFQELEDQMDGQRSLRGDATGSIAYHIAIGVLDQKVED